VPAPAPAPQTKRGPAAAQEEPAAKKPKAASLLLPSAADLFSSVAAPSFFAPTAAQPEMDLTIKPKDQQTRQPPTKAVTAGGLMAPPQLKRPNKSTEEAGAWNSDKTAAAAAKKAKDGSKWAGDKGERTAAHRKREHAKRQTGQSSRGNSFVGAWQRGARLGLRRDCCYAPGFVLYPTATADCQGLLRCAAPVPSLT
jgi:hypothetical protein